MVKDKDIRFFLDRARMCLNKGHREQAIKLLAQAYLIQDAITIYRETRLAETD